MEEQLFVYLILFILLSIIFYYLLYPRKKSSLNSRHPPSFPSLPIVGSLPFIAKGGHRLYHFFMEKSAELGDIYTFYAGRRLSLVLNGREAITDALVNHAIEFADRSPLWTEENFLNTRLRGITFKHYGESFKKCHSVASSALSHLTIGDNTVAQTRIRKGVETVISEIRRRRGTAFDPKVLFNEFSGTTILSVLLGERFLQQNLSRARDIISSSDAYLACIDPMLDVMPMLRFLPMFRNKLKTMAASKEKLMQIIHEEVEISVKKDAGKSFAKSFIENKIYASELNLEELVYIVRDLVFGAIVTVATTLLWAVVLLANNPEIQHQMRKEIESVIPADRLPTMKDKERLPYVEAVLLEILRRKGVTPFSSTRATTKDTELQGYLIPAKCMVLVNLYSAHMNSKDWEDPETFQPSRFLNGRRIIKKELVIPFSLGARSCIGEAIAHQELFLLLCSLVQNFDIRPPSGTERISEKENYQLVLAPDPFKICFIPRHTNA